MLNLFRRRDLLIRILLAVILGTVIVMLVVTLIPGFGGYTDTYDSTSLLAEVGGEQITLDQIERGIRRVSRNTPVPPSLYPIYGRMILDQLILQSIMTQEGKRLGVRVSDFEVAEQIHQIPLFYPGGTFIGKERYQDLVEQRFGMTVSEFEQQVKADLMMEKVYALVTDGIVVTPAEVKWEYQRRNEKITIEFMSFRGSDEAAALTSGPAQLQSHYQANRNRYQVPEKRRAKYLLISQPLLQSEIKVADEELREYYQRNLEAYRIPERVRVSHILFKTVGQSDAEVEKTRQQGLEVLRQLKRGAKFADLARQYSEDPGSKDKGGELGWISRGQTVPAFEQTAFTLGRGRLSELVKTEYGFHILRVEEKQAAHLQTLAEVRAKIEPTLLQEKFERVAQERANKISDEIHRQGRSLEEVARQYNLPVLETQLFSADEQALSFGRIPEFNDAAFRLRLNETSGQIRAANGLLLLKLTEIQKAHQGEMTEPDVAAKVKQDFLKERGNEQARRKAGEALGRIRKGESLAQVAKQMGVKVETSQPFTRDASVADLGSAREFVSAFELPLSGTGGPLELRGRFVVYRVAARVEIERAAFERDRATLEKQLLDQKRTQVYELFKEGVRQQMIGEGRLRLYENNLKRLVRTS